MAHAVELCEHRQRDVRRVAPAHRDADRRVEAVERVVVDAVLAQARADVVGLVVGGDEADVVRPAFERLPGGGPVERPAPGGDGDGGVGGDAERGDAGVVVARVGLGVGEAFGVGELLAVIDDEHLVLHLARQPRQRDGDVPPAREDQARPAGEDVDEHRHLAAADHPGVAASSEFPPLGPRRPLLDGLERRLAGEFLDGATADGTLRRAVHADEHRRARRLRGAPLDGRHRRERDGLPGVGEVGGRAIDSHHHPLEARPS